MNFKSMLARFALGVCLISPVFAVTAEHDPKVQLEAVTEAMITDIEAHKEQLKTDIGLAKTLIRKHLLPGFDGRTMGRKVLGHYWRDASEQQRQAFVNEFTNLAIDTYAKGLSLYSGQTFKYNNTQYSRSGKTAKVRSEMLQPEGPPVKIDYRLRQDGEESWKITDVIIEGISMAKSYQNQYRELINKQGLDKTIKQLKEQRAALNKAQQDGRADSGSELQGPDATSARVTADEGQDNDSEEDDEM